MKCKACGKKVIARLGKTEITAGGKAVKVINIPAFYCENCGNEDFHELVLKKAESYALTKNLPAITLRSKTRKTKKCWRTVFFTILNGLWSFTVQMCEVKHEYQKNYWTEKRISGFADVSR